MERLKIKEPISKEEIQHIIKVFNKKWYNPEYRYKTVIKVNGISMLLYGDPIVNEQGFIFNSANDDEVVFEWFNVYSFEFVFKSDLDPIENKIYSSN